MRTISLWIEVEDEEAEECFKKLVASLSTELISCDKELLTIHVRQAK